MLSGCTSAPPAGQATLGPQPVVVGSDGTVVSAVLARIYAGTLSRSGASVLLAPASASRAEAIAALDDASVTFVPDFSGDLLAELDPGSTATTSEEVFEALNRSLPEWLSVADAAGAENRETVAVTAATADALAGATLADLAPTCSVATAAVTDDAALPPLRETYGCSFATAVTTDAADARTMLRDNVVQVAIIPATEVGAEDAGEREVTLADSDDAYRAQNVVPLFHKGSLGEQQTTALGVVAGDLTTADLADMVDQVRGGESPDAVAEAWLGERNF